MTLMKTIDLYRTRTGYVAVHSDPAVRQLFGSIYLPTAFTQHAHGLAVLRDIQDLNPGVQVRLAPWCSCCGMTLADVDATARIMERDTEDNYCCEAPIPFPQPAIVCVECGQGKEDFEGDGMPADMPCCEEYQMFRKSA